MRARSERQGNAEVYQNPGGLITWVSCNVEEVEVYGLARRSNLILALMLETKLKVGIHVAA
jgi:hypothetical protein